MALIHPLTQPLGARVSTPQSNGLPWPYSSSQGAMACAPSVMKEVLPEDPRFERRCGVGRSEAISELMRPTKRSSSWAKWKLQ